MRGKSHCLGTRRAPLDQHTGHFGNDISSPPNHHAVTHADVLAPDLVHVVKRGVADRDTTDEDRREPRNRGQRTCPAHLELDVPDHGDLLLCGKLVGQRPAWRA